MDAQDVMNIFHELRQAAEGPDDPDLCDYCGFDPCECDRNMDAQLADYDQIVGNV